MKKPKKSTKNNLLLFGLGNPGDEYRETRHNAGFAVIDSIAEKFNASLKKAFLRPFEYVCIETDADRIFLVKPLTYMNRSGLVLDYIMKKFGTKPEDLVIICDNMDLKPGIIRLKKKGSSAGHNGIKSVIEYLGSSEFPRMYIGIGRSKTGETVVEHVLGRFDEDDKRLFDESVESAAGALLSLTERTFEQVMNEINQKNK